MEFIVVFLITFKKYQLNSLKKFKLIRKKKEWEERSLGIYDIINLIV